jgi:hypothetical protein
VLRWFTRTGMVKRELEDAAFEQESDSATPLGRLAELADTSREGRFPFLARFSLRYRPTHSDNEHYGVSFLHESLSSRIGNVN